MKVLISKSTISGKAIASPSKSYTLRALICAALAKGESRIFNVLNSDDSNAARDVLIKIGTRINIQGNVWHIEGGTLHPPDSELFCKESAGTIRFMMALCSLIPGKSILTAGPALMKRPMSTLVTALQQLGVNCFSSNGYPPVTIEGGRIKGGIVELPGNISSQFLSALLFIGPLVENGLEIRLTTPLESEAYVLMTIACLNEFGINIEYSPDQQSFVIGKQIYKPSRFIIEGDWSSASYLLALGAVAGSVEVKNVRIDSLQGDNRIVPLLKKMGASVRVRPDSVTVTKSPLVGIEADLNDCIDLLPTMAVLAAAASGESKFTGISRARLKESNRIASMKEGLKSMGVDVTESSDTMVIQGRTVNGAVIDPKNDHRIAMAFSILGTIAGNTTIQNAECVSKTYPEYWDVFQKIGGKVKYEQ